MKSVAADAYVEQAVADMGEVAVAFLARLHRDEVDDAQGEASLHLRAHPAQPFHRGVEHEKSGEQTDESRRADLIVPDVKQRDAIF